MTKNNKRLIIFFIFLAFFFVLILLKVEMPTCPLKKIFNISCPSCGLTRSIRAIFTLDFKKNIYYNILGIPFLLTFLIIYLLIIHDLIKKENYLSSFCSYLIKHYKIIIFLLILSFILNNIHKV